MVGTTDLDGIHFKEGRNIMKKVAAVVAVAALVLSLVSLVFAAEMGTIKSVDAKAGTVVYCAEGGQDMTLKADKSVDLSSLKAGEKVEAVVENNMLKSVKAAPVVRHRAPVGC
jgi:Spy/CpxP family protein refolding chaperone